MLRRMPQDRQLDLFEGALLYLSQSDAARALGITTRMIQYWESQGLLNPELPMEGRSRRYTTYDLVELRFIKGMVVDQGFTVPSLKEKLGQLQPPFYYDPDDAFWDNRDQRWKSRSDFAAERLAEIRDQVTPLAADALERLLPGDSTRAIRSLLDLVREVLEGRAPKPRKRRKKG
ncbi:MAG: MerR family transcriptional regulator [Candidatus Eremiobacteraeota bacterium]|nr:MerR family transcriptional regulator [Candidatus Eremiobacteraeota bacterium]